MSDRKKATVILVALFVLSGGLLAWQIVEQIGAGLQAGFDSEFLVRSDGYPGLKDAYAFEFERPPMHMDPGLMYKACAWGWVDVICGFATDGRIAAYDLKILEDDKKFFPPYYAAPLVRAETLEEFPQLREVLNRLGERIDAKTMQRLNLLVDREANPRDAETVAREWLIEAGLIDADAEPNAGRAGSVTVVGKNFTEQEILGQIMAILIETQTDIAVERKLNLGGTMVCFNALKGKDADFYAEYTGTGLVGILDREAVGDPQKAYDIVEKTFREKWDLVWLTPFGFNNTYTITMRREHAERLGLETISDLAEYTRNQH